MVKPSSWRSVPYISGRAATEEDVKAGRAVFYAQSPNGSFPEPYTMELPACGIFREEGVGPEVPVIVIQAEVVNGLVTVGYRLIRGGNGVCTFDEIELLPGPDHRFTEKGTRIRGRGLLPDAFKDGMPVLLKACSQLRLTYEIKLAQYLAAQSGSRLRLEVNNDCRFSHQLQQFISQHGIITGRSKV